MGKKTAKDECREDRAATIAYKDVKIAFLPVNQICLLTDSFDAGVPNHAKENSGSFEQPP